ncbi:MAG: hypothetical protein N4A46_11880 [Schleiferiaceae bacterium]|jgi:hypothetical protein|nr:hypothetical protein [Schleiferiaceae bacterium]
MESSRHIFIEKLDRFIRKYYQNQLLRGLILSKTMLLTYLLLVSFSEYFLYWSVGVKTFFFIGFILLFLWILIRLIVLPINGLLRIGKTITHRQAIAIINYHFPELEDKLINTLELSELYGEEEIVSSSLLLASINQRIDEIKLVPFRKAINFRDNLRFLKYLGALSAVTLVSFFLIPDLFSESSKRLIHFRTKYSPPAAFSFQIEEQVLEVEKGSDFVLNISTRGSYYPSQAYLLIDETRFLLQRKSAGNFSYVFRNVNHEIIFQIESGNVTSEPYNLKVLNKPTLKSFQIQVEPPKYTGINGFVEKNIGDISVPEGAFVEWILEGEDIKNMELVFSDSINSIKKIEGERFKFTRSLKNKVNYSLALSNNDFKLEEFAKYNVDIIKDQFPQIQVISTPDSIINTALYFKGIIKDDYGFSKLRFVCEAGDRPAIFVPINIKKRLISQEFYFAFDFADDGIELGENVQYYFEVFDNDKINTPKKTRSEQLSFYIPDSNEIFDLNSIVQDDINKKIKEGINLSESIQEDILRMQKGALDGSTEKWQQDQLLNEIGEKKAQLDDLLKEIRDENRRKNQLMNSNLNQDSLLLEKQKQIDELLEKVMDDDLKKLFEEFNKLKENFSREELNKKGNKLKMSFEDFQRQMERNLQLLQRYEVEIQMKQLIDRVEKIAERHEKASDELRKENQELKNQIEKDKKAWEEFQNDFSNVIDKNNQIEKPYQFDQMDDEINEISDFFKRSENLINEGKSGKTLKNMKQTSRKQRELAKKMNNAMMQSSVAQLSVDVDNLIRLMNNLIEFSFQQEKNLLDLKMVNYRNPQYVEIILKQGVLNDEYKLIQDSLFSLSSRSPQIASLIGNKIFDIKNYLDKVVEEANNRRKIQANAEQQKALTEINDLSIFLSEALMQLMEQMANAMPGDQLGDKKGGMPSLGGLKSQQQSLKKMLEDLISQMKNSDGKKNSNESLGKFLKQQEMFKENVNELLQKGDVGHESEKILREVMKMVDQIESDVSNFSINSNTIFRQNRILTRLLEAENAKREKDFDKGRESKSGNILKLSNPKEIFEYKRVRTDFDDVFYDTNIKLFDYYNKLYLDYMIKLNND